MFQAHRRRATCFPEVTSCKTQLWVNGLDSLKQKRLGRLMLELKCLNTGLRRPWILAHRPFDKLPGMDNRNRYSSGREYRGT